MNIVILAREHSARFPRKHLAMIGGKTLIAGIVEKCLRHGDTYLATGPERENASLGNAAYAAGAYVYYESSVPEWDIHTRVANLCKFYELESFLLYGGDSPWIDGRMIDLVGSITPPPGGTVAALAPTAPGGIEARGIQHISKLFWDSLCEGVPMNDRRREEPWQFGPKTPREGLDLFVPVPWQIMTGTAIKTSCDYPFEAAIDDLIARHLGFWPETDEQIIQAYCEITKIESVNPGVAGN